jgi:hypothetical protein
VLTSPSIAEEEADIVKWIDGNGDYSTANVSARLPPEHDEYVTPAQLADKYRRDKIMQHMVHRCAVAENGCKKTAATPCKRGFDNKPTNGEPTSFSDKGKPIYQRGAGDGMIVSHNIDMLLDWDGHINVEYAANAKSVMYLYDYLFKGDLHQSISYWTYFSTFATYLSQSLLRYTYFSLFPLHVCRAEEGARSYSR